jgi:hypothetical protein
LQRLLQPQSATVEDRPDQPVLVLESGEDGAHFRVRKYDGQMARRFRTHDVLEPRQFEFEYLLVQEQQGGQGLVLRRRRDFPHDRKVRQEGLDFRRAHLPRMPLLVEEDVAADPLQVLLLGAIAVMQRPQLFPHLVEQAGRPSTRGRFLIRIHAA